MPTALISTAMLWLAAATAPSTVTVTVTVDNVRNDKGHVLAAVCSQAEFLKPHCTYTASAPSHRGGVTIEVTGVPPGRYAIQVFQDENDNHKIDRNLLGIPEEGMGFSNNAPFRFGPPDFNDAAVTVGPDGGSFSIRLRYF